jgi:UPF0271 protein
MTRIDLNSDMGESFGVYSLGNDEQAMPFITSANIACGFHASDPLTMRKTVRLAKKYGVAVGAHPSFPDLVGFGRRAMDIPVEEITADTIYQIGSLLAFCRAEGIKLQHVKVHGALYNVAVKNIGVAIALAEAIKSIDPDLYMVCLSNSTMVEAAKKTGTRHVQEIFADRAYTNQGLLVPRGQEGAVIHDPARVAERVLMMARERRIIAVDGTSVQVNAETVCVHADTPGSVELLKAIRAGLEREKITFKAFGK